MSKTISIGDLVEINKPKLVEKKVKFTGYDDEEYEVNVFVKKVNFKECLDLHECLKYKPDGKGNLTYNDFDAVTYQSRCVLFSICNEDGDRVFKDESEVLKSNDTLMAGLWVAADEVNNFMGKLIPKNLQKTNSGANSSSTESAAKQSKKPKQTSRIKKLSSGENTDQKEEVSTSEDD